MFSLFWIFGFYLAGVFIERISWKWVLGILAFAGLDVAWRIYLRLQTAHAQGLEFAWPLHKMIGFWLALSAFAGFFLFLGRWKNSVRRRRREELSIR